MDQSRFVSRSGEKLEFAIENFGIDVKDKITADFGSSTGGFVDCLLRYGASRVYSVDVAYGELAWKLRNDPRIVVMERTNAMHVLLPEKVDLITVDCSWTKQEKILPNAYANLMPDGVIISLIKPHYEYGRAKLNDDEVEQTIAKVKLDINSSGGKIEQLIESPLLGEKGKNREFLAKIVLK